MSQDFPADRTLVDDQRKIVDPWLGPLKRLAPLLTLTNEDFTALKALIAAARTPATDDSGDILDPFELEIDEDPVFSEDYVIGWRTALTAARRFPLTLFATPVLISTTGLSGAATADFALPTGYTSAQLRIFGASATSGSPVITAAFSEDSGSSFLSQAYYVFNDAAAASSASATAGNLQHAAISNAYSHYGRLDLWNYQSAVDKHASSQAFIGLVGSVTSGCVGSHLITSTAPVNLIRLAVSAGGGNFDAGSVELWGIP